MRRGPLPHNPISAARTLSVLLFGALGLIPLACGGSRPAGPLPSPSPSPSPLVCAQLSEEGCNTTPTCAPQYIEEGCVCAPCSGPVCEPCNCEPVRRVYVGCLDRDPCEGLNEPSCLADARCEAIFRVPGCDRPCAPGDPSCGGCGQPQYAGCQTKTTPQCPPTCEIFCPYGHQVDAAGCALCACNPPPSGCEALDPYVCAATPGCRLEQTGGGCVCPACAPGSECPPCDCAGGRALPAPDGGSSDPAPDGGVSDGGPAPGFRCVAIDACGGLDEQSCRGTPGCSPVYSAGSAPCSCPTPEACGCEDQLPVPSSYAGCIAEPTDPCQRLSESECLTDADTCEPRYVTACPVPPPGGEDAGAPRPPDCTTTYAGCFSTGAPSCTSDADCPNAYCELTELCDRGGTCTVSGVCRAARCDDGPALCEALPPICPVGQVAAARNGCWTCLDARTCADPNAPTCLDDGACPNGYCAFGPTAPGIPPPAGGQCVFPTCGDGSTLACRRAMPLCPAGQTPEIVNGCYGDCVDARTCSSQGPQTPCTTDADCINGYCGSVGSGTGSGGGGGRPAPPPLVCNFPVCRGDGGPVSCLIELYCPPGQAPAPRDGCFECVDARTCG